MGIQCSLKDHDKQILVIVGALLSFGGILGEREVWPVISPSKEVISPSAKDKITNTTKYSPIYINDRKSLIPLFYRF